MSINPIFYAFHILSNYPLACIVAIFDCIASVGFSFIPSYIIKNIIFCMTQYSDFNEFMIKIKPYIFIYIIFFIISIFIFRIYDYIICVKTFPSIKKHLIVEHFTNILKHSKAFFQQYLFGDIVEKIDDLQKNLVELLKWIFTKFFTNTLSIIASSSLLIYFNFQCGILVLCWIILFIFIGIFFGKKIVKLGATWTNQLSFLNGFMVDTLYNFITVKVFNNVNYEKIILNQHTEEIKKTETKIEFYFLICWAIYALSFFIVQIGCLYILLNQYKIKIINASDFAFVWSINSSIVSILWKLLRDFVELPEYYSSIEQSLKVLDAPIEIKSITNKKLDTNQNGASIEFQNVSFSFENKIILDKINITINPLEKIGIVGLSGSGKSTFINLILRLYDIESGKILINQTNIKDISLDTLYDLVSIIPQEPILFNRTILENLTYSNIKATDTMIQEAIKLANLEDFLRSLPKGLNTTVGNLGSSLSGGQKQRIAIARAYLKKNASILILDEATSNLDSITEINIQKSLDIVSQNQTVLIIAHRLSTLENVNRILVFSDGKIVQDGNHKELISQNGVYKNLWTIQKNLIDN